MTTDRATTQDGPATAAVDITPHDSNNFDAYSRAIYVGGAGDVVVVPMSGDGTVTLKAVPAGTLIPIRAKRVNSTGTTATFLVNLY